MMKLFPLISVMVLLATSGIAQATTVTSVFPNTPLPWTAARSLPPGAQIAILSGDPKKKGTFVARIKFPANYSIPVHMHPINEYDTVLSGELFLGVGLIMDMNKGIKLPMGSFVKIPANMPHYAWTKEETVVQVMGVGPWGMIYPKTSSKT
jgi:quercetin dioxygenase-like cupin family protein